jgi:hypothetical protein
VIDLELIKRLDADWDGDVKADSDFARQDRRVLLAEVERLRKVVESLQDENVGLRELTDRLIIAADRREDQIAEPWDEVERLRGVVERLKLEKFDLAERLMRQSSDPT